MDVPSLVVEFWILFLDPQESLELVRFLDCWDHNQVLQVALQNVSAVVNHVGHWATSGTWASRVPFYLDKTFVGKLIGALGELDAWVLVNQRLVELAERFVLLCHHPSFIIVERNLDAVLGIGSVITRVLNHEGFFDLAVDTHQEKVGPTKVIHVFWASLEMLQENFRGVERVAKLALRCHTKLEAL
jgi:hypothetical protein